jgi:hypothetical protein
MRWTSEATLFVLLASLLACRAEERIDPPEILGGAPKVIYSEFKWRVAISHRHPETPWVLLSGRRNNLWLNMDDLTVQNDDNSKNSSDYKGISNVKVFNSAEQGDWRAIFEGRFLERDEHIALWQGLMPSEIKTVHTRRFTGDVILYLQGNPILKQHFTEALSNFDYPFKFDYSPQKGLLAFQYTDPKKVDEEGPVRDACRIYLFKFPPSQHAPPASLMETLQQSGQQPHPLGSVVHDPTRKQP